MENSLERPGVLNNRPSRRQEPRGKQATLGEGRALDKAGPNEGTGLRHNERSGVLFHHEATVTPEGNNSKRNLMSRKGRQLIDPALPSCQTKEKVVFSVLGVPNLACHRQQPGGKIMLLLTMHDI